MKRLLAVALGIAATSVALAGLVVRAQESRPQTWQVPLTPWGHPNLQGIWTTDAEIGIPVERPVQFGEKALLTDQEVGWLVEFLRDGLLDPRARYGTLEHLIPRQVPSGRATLTFEDPSPKAKHAIVANASHDRASGS